MMNFIGFEDRGDHIDAVEETQETEQKAFDWPCTNYEYHHDCSRVSHTSKEHFRKCRKRYHALYVAFSMAFPEPSASMRLGSMVHSRILEPELFDAGYVVAPKVDRRTKEGKAVWSGFVSENAGKQLIEREDASLVEAIARAVGANETAARLLTVPGETEHSIVWLDEETGIWCKSRRDRVLDHLIIDLKTCRDASPVGFSKSCATFGYHRQAAWYLDGHLHRFGTSARFAFIAICTEPPHEVAVYELDQDALRLGRRENRQALAAMGECHRTGDWIADHERGVTALKLPKWTEFQDQWEM